MSMIFWRGWGILAFLAIGASVGLTAIFAALSGTDLDNASWQGIPAFFMVGAGLFFLGRRLNITGPVQKLTELIAQHGGQAAPPAPSINHLHPEQRAFGPEELPVLKRMQNRHTFFFIPMQWWGFVLPVIGILITVNSGF